MLWQPVKRKQLLRLWNDFKRELCKGNNLPYSVWAMPKWHICVFPWVFPYHKTACSLRRQRSSCFPLHEHKTPGLPQPFVLRPPFERNWTLVIMLHYFPWWILVFVFVNLSHVSKGLPAHTSSSRPAPNGDGLPMMVDLPSVALLLVRPHPVDEGVEKHLDPRNNLGEDEPDIDHLHVGRLRKTAWNADEQSGEDQQGGEVHWDNCLKRLHLKCSRWWSASWDRPQRKKLWRSWWRRQWWEPAQWAGRPSR